MTWIAVRDIHIQAIVKRALDQDRNQGQHLLTVVVDAMQRKKETNAFPRCAHASAVDA